MTKSVRTKAPNEHKKTFEAFKTYVDEGIIDAELLYIYEDELVKAKELLSMYQRERTKRGHYTYKTLPQANEKPAKTSMKNAEHFMKHLIALTS